MLVQIIRKREVAATEPISPSMDFTLTMNYAEAASIPYNKVELSLKEIQQCYNLLKAKGRDIFIS